MASPLSAMNPDAPPLVKPTDDPSEGRSALDALREATWVQRGAAGDREALRQIVLAHQTAIVRLLLRLSNGDRELAADLAQDTFVRAFSALGTFRLGAALRPWLFRIANNLFLDHMRRKRPESLDALDEGGDERGAEDQAILAIANDTDLGAALAALPVPWRQALILRHDDDMAYEDIAAILEVPLGTVKTWIYRGRERLRVLLTDPNEVAGRKTGATAPPELPPPTSHDVAIGALP